MSQETSCVQHFQGRDGIDLGYRSMGEGRPLVLLHGFFSDATINWVRYGHAAALAARGHRVILPDLRGHGESARPHDAASYPPDVLADDGLALVDALGLSGYDLGGYSLGGRTVARMLVRGARPERAVIAGMGLSGITDSGARNGHFRRILTGLGTFERGTPEWQAEAFLRTTGGDPLALLGVLGSFVPTSVEDLRAIEVPTLALTGDADTENGSAAELAEVLPQGSWATVPGTHMGAVTKPDLGTTIGEFLRR